VNQFRKIIFWVAVVLTMSACVPMYKTSYKFEPPASHSGAMCVQGCQYTKSNCKRTCSVKYHRCILNAREDARFQYESYKDRQYANHEKIDRDLESFYHPDRCRENCRCGPQFRSCYQECGGTVIADRQCKAFCKPDWPESSHDKPEPYENKVLSSL